MLTRISSSIATIIFLFGLLSCSRSETLSTTEIVREHKLAQIEKQGQITIGIRPNAPPFAFVDRQNGDRLGLEIDIARYITKELLGSEDRVRFIPIFDANQRIALLEQDKIDLAIAALFQTPENQETIDLSESYYASGVGLLTRKDNQIQNWSDLENKKVCAVRGMFYNAALEEMGMELIRLRDRSDAYVALQDGRCLGFAYDNSEIASVLQLSQWSQNWHQALPVLFSIPWSVGIPKGETELKQAVNAAILKMSAEGLIINNEAKWKIPPTEYTRDRRNFARTIVTSQPIANLKTREAKDINLRRSNILIDGSAVVFPIADRIAEKFMDLHPESRIAIGISGNQQGFTKFCQGNIDLVKTTRPIESSEIQLCAENDIEYIELPIAFDIAILNEL
jgi:polar amino acid transport system substrate-binding protein